MEKQERRLQLLENFIYLIIWVVVLVMPLWDTDRFKDTSEFDWESAFHAWKMICPLLILFLVNNYILLPFLLVRKKSWLYLLFTICAIGLTIIVSIKNMSAQDMPGNRPPWGNNNREQALEQRSPMIPEKRLRTNPQIPDHRFNPDSQPNPGVFRLPPFIAPHFLIVILIIGVNMAIKFLFKSIRDDHRMKSLEKQTSEAELAYLKHQINPHFFMNTLNNIHALVSIDPAKAEETIEVLSKLMRYVLYDGDKPLAPLEKETQFLNNYVELMRIRYASRVRIDLNLPEVTTKKMVPPLIFVTFVENAFKHGVSYERKSFIEVGLMVDEVGVRFTCRNSCNPSEDKSYGGVGLSNVRKRLDLIYHDAYKLEIAQNEAIYDVCLSMPFLTSAEEQGLQNSNLKLKNKQAQPKKSS